MPLGTLCRRCGALNVPGTACGCTPPLTIRRGVYDSSRWQQYTRPVVLARDCGLCQNCGEPGRVVAHLLAIETLIALAQDPYDPANCRTLCERCSGREDGGRAGAPLVARR